MLAFLFIYTFIQSESSNSHLTHQHKV